MLSDDSERDHNVRAWKNMAVKIRRGSGCVRTTSAVVEDHQGLVSGISTAHIMRIDSLIS